MRISKKTKLTIILITIVIALLASILGILGFNYQKSHMVIAKVNGEKIYQFEVEDKLAKMFKNQDQKVNITNFPAPVVESLVRDIYLQKQLDKEAQKSKFAKDKAIQKQITEYKNSVIRQAYLDDIVASKVNDQAVKDKYSELSGELAGKNEVHIKHILVDSETEAQNIIKQLQNKKISFEQLAKKYSKDEANAPLGGDLGYVIPDNLDEDFAKAIIDLKKNQISSPIKTKFGYHIVKVEDSRAVQLPAFEDVKGNIEDQLKQETLEKVFNQITRNSQVKILVKLKVQEPEAIPNQFPKELPEDNQNQDAKK